MKQFLILLDWYEYNLTAVIKAKNKIKALETLINKQIEHNKKINQWDLSDNIPYFYYDDELTERQNIAKYFKQILNKDVRFLAFEINQNTNGFINYTNFGKYELIQIEGE